MKARVFWDTDALTDAAQRTTVWMDGDELNLEIKKFAGPGAVVRLDREDTAELLELLTAGLQEWQEFVVSLEPEAE